MFCFFFSSRRRHTSLTCDWSSDVCSSDLDPVAVAVERDAQLGVLATHRGLQVVEILGHGGIGVVIGERPVRLAEQRYDLRAYLPQRGDCDHAGDAVPAVDDDLYPPCERAVTL